MTSKKTIVIGGGASGMLAAIGASQHSQVTLLEKAPRLGRKLAVTGNGRCNLSNENLSYINFSLEHYHGDDPAFAAYALQRYPVAMTMDYFEREFGLLTVTEPSGRIYPYTNQASTVVDVLRLKLAERQIDVKLHTTVTGIARSGGGFKVHVGEETLSCDYLIVAAGGLAGTKYGGSRSGYELLGSLGHTCTPLYPSLVQLKTENSFTRPLRGVRMPAHVTLWSGETFLAENNGEVQFTEYGLSGPAIFEISRAAATAKGNVTVGLDLGWYASDRVNNILRMRKWRGGRTMEHYFTGILPNIVGRTLVTRCGIPLDRPVSKLTSEEELALSIAMRDVTLPLTGTMGFDSAQVTAGGIRTSEFDPETVESRLVPNLYACGEVLDIDGDCGGYNLQWAWSSGQLAGEMVAKKAYDQSQ